MPASFAASTASVAKPVHAHASAATTVTPRAFARRLRRRLDAWRATSRHCGRQATELWQLRLPLATMLGLTLIGLYDFRAITPPPGSAPACELAAAWCDAPTITAAPAPAESSATGLGAASGIAATTPATVQTASASTDLPPAVRTVGTAAIQRTEGAAPEAAAGAAARPTERTFCLTCRMVAADRSALAPPRT